MTNSRIPCKGLYKNLLSQLNVQWPDSIPQNNIFGIIVKGITGRTVARLSVLFVIDFYRTFLSSYVGNGCRFTPSCSEYGKRAFESQPFFKALALMVKRILKCRPGGPYGYDPVPEIGKGGTDE